MRFRVLGGVFLMMAAIGAIALSAASARAQALPATCPGMSQSQCDSLKAQYQELQDEIAQEQQVIAQTEAQKNTYSGNVANLNAQIAAAQKQIDAQNLQITQLSAEISAKNETISELEDQVAEGKESLASILRQESQLDDYTPVEVALSAEDISTFFSDVDAFASIKRDMANLFDQIQSAEDQTETEKDALADTQSQVADAKYSVQTKQSQLSVNKSEQQQLLAVASSSEAAQQQVLAANQAKAAQIRAALFPLRDTGAIQFGTALTYAQTAQKATGVDAAFILAILTQESNLGANVGQCYLTNDTTGAGQGKNTGTPFANVMNPTRDVPPFLALAQKLGFDPHQQVVSCPQGGGWGGAMGPSQFIASTWTAYESRIASATGDAVPNPWNAQDAIMATALYMEDLGAAGGGYTAEHTAAAKYYAGGAWATAGQSYANSVMNTVLPPIEQNIEFLAQNS